MVVERFLRGPIGSTASAALPHACAGSSGQTGYSRLAQAAEPWLGRWQVAPAKRRLQRPAPLRSRTRQPKRTTQAAAYKPYPWEPNLYYKVALQVVQADLYGGGTPSGTLLLMRESSSGQVEDAERGLLVAVGGDTMAGIAMLAQGRAGERPLSLDLLWSVLERGQELSRRDWRVLRVAIVELRGATFIGRLFFGDPASGKVAWDVDCRPSDGMWIALKSGCPFFVAKKVWDANSASLKEMARSESDPPAAADPRSQAEQRRRGAGGGSGAGLAGLGLSWEAEAAGGDPDSPFALMTTLRRDDPEPLTLLKMELRVALRSEDYEAAALIRDHPFMRLHVAMVSALRAGDSSRAYDLEEELGRLITEMEASGSVSDGDAA